MNTLQADLGFISFRRLPRSSGFRIGLMLIATSWLVGCATAPAQPSSMIDEKANFDDYKTFGWMVPASPEQPLQLAESKLRQSITAEMLSKGYVEAADDSTADLLLDYDAEVHESLKSSPFRVGFGLGSYGSHGGASIGTSTSGVKEISEGSLVIHAIDSARSTEVWRSGVSRELSKDGVDADAIRSAVAEVFYDFPARSVTP